MYWVVFAAFCVCEAFLDVLLGIWLPFYSEAKLLFLLWLVSPVSGGGSIGASILYRKVVHPNILKREAVSKQKEKCFIFLVVNRAKVRSVVISFGIGNLNFPWKLGSTNMLQTLRQILQPLLGSYRNNLLFHLSAAHRRDD